jgi:hypothetical protein
MFQVLRELVLTYKILGQQNSTGSRAWWVAAPIDSRARINQSNSYRTITAAAGTELAGASSSSPVMIETRRKSLTSDSALLHPRDIAGSGVSPLSNIPHCCPPRESGPCLSPSVADHPKRPAKHHWLGQPLPNQLPDTTWAHRTARISLLYELFRIWSELFGRFPRVTHPFATLLAVPHAQRTTRISFE